MSLSFSKRRGALTFVQNSEMKLFKIFAGIMGFFALVFVVSLFFPRQYRIERYVVLNMPVYESFAYMNQIRNWKDWSPWNEDLDSSMVSFYSQQSAGKGATQYFRGGLVGVGRFMISESVLNQKISYNLSINGGTMQSAATFYFSEAGGKTKLSWVDEGDVGYNPIFRYLLPGKIKDTEQAFEEGLAAIKRAAESRKLLE